MGDLIPIILGFGVAVTAIGTLGSGMYFFITGAKANQKTAELRESETALNKTRVESEIVANRVANEMGRKLASVAGLGEFTSAYGRKPKICNCSNCNERRGEGND